MNTQKALFVATLAQDAKHLSPAQVVYHAQKLIAIARAQERAALALCNGQATQDEHIVRVKRTRARLAPHLSALRIKRATLGGDPRGYAVKLHLRSGEYNTWGGASEGYGVPTEGR